MYEWKQRERRNYFGEEGKDCRRVVSWRKMFCLLNRTIGILVESIRGNIFGEVNKREACFDLE